MTMLRYCKYNSDIHGFTGASRHVGETYSITVLSSCFVDQAADHNSQRILMYYGSKDFIWRP